MLALIPWGYFVGKQISNWGRTVLATFFSIVFFAFSIRAFVDHDWDDFRISLGVGAFFTVLACGFWTDWNFKFQKVKANGAIRKQNSREGEIVKKVAEEALGASKQTPVNPNNKKA
jgi:hypothetical protein